MRPPLPRGPLSLAIEETLAAPAGAAAHVVRAARHAVATVARGGNVLGDEDIQLSLYLLYELHYRGLDGVDERWEWAPDLLAARGVLEAPFETALRELAGAPATAADPGGDPDADPASDVAQVLFALVAADDGPSVSRFLERRGDVDQWREFLVHRSAYHLKEADPHTWAIPRLSGRPKAALVEIQADEYGGGRPERMHAALFAQTMRALGLDDTYGALLDGVPAVSLATVNVMSLFGLHRRLRGACAGHLTALEMSSSLPNRRYGNGLRRLGFGPDATAFFDEHVEADAVHEQIAAHDLAAALVAQSPHLRADVLFGARVALAIDARAGAHLLGCWQDGRSSLRPADPGLAA